MAEITEREVLRLLRARHPAPAWAFLDHVANGTGRHQQRTADALAMSLWPSRGLELHGFEVKVYRSDWLRELKDPAKADEIAARCHRWWVVVGDESIIQQGDLFPQTWGQMVVRDGELVVTREAPLIEPAPLDHVFLAAILRRAATAFCQREEEATRRDRGAALVPAPTEADVARWMARLERLSTTTSLIQNDIRQRLYALRYPQRSEGEETEGT
jgi:hypothetical protein